MSGESISNTAFILMSAPREPRPMDLALGAFAVATLLLLVTTLLVV